MGFQLGTNSNKHLVGVHIDLVRVVRRAILVTEVDFGVIDGLRSIERQRKLVADGLSDTLNSRHLTGHAVDLAAFAGNQVSNRMADYFEIAAAMKMASEALGVPIRWGGAWTILAGNKTPAELQSFYKADRKRLGRKPFIDAMHFELPVGAYP